MSDKTKEILAEDANTAAVVDTGADTVVDTGADTVAGEAGAPEHRDERHDSIDRVTGTLTDEAVELRAEHGISQSGEQVPEPADTAE